MSDIQPTEAELLAAGRHSLNDSDCFCQECVTQRAISIARLTRYEGKTAEEWARLQQQTAFVVSEVNLRAEAAEAKVTELEAENAKLRKYLEDYELEAGHVLKGGRPHIERIAELEAKLDAAIAAIAEAVSKRTEEGGSTLLTLTKFGCTPEARAWNCAVLECSRFILALNAPPAPAYPFEKPCKCWEQQGNRDYWTREVGDYVHDLDAHFTHCPFCGAPRKGI
jgi:hypothetical protein